jgi:hypothetical protein
VPGSHPEHTGPAGADEHARPSLAPGEHIKSRAGDLIGDPGVICLGAIKQPGDDGQRLLEPVYALPRGRKWNTRRLVFGLSPPCSHAELKPPPDRWWRLAASWATITGCRKSLASTSVPTCRRLVTVAAAGCGDRVRGRPPEHRVKVRRERREEHRVIQ